MQPHRRWEQGSEIQLLSYQPVENPVPEPWKGKRRFYASGRDALRALLAYGVYLGWERLWVPSYFCQEVVAALSSAGIALKIYTDAPTENELILEDCDFVPGDVVLVVNYFGLRSKQQLNQKGILTIEDHTHDPWSDWAFHSEADWCIASLRKTLPLPDGAVLWSPVGRSLPPPSPITDERSQASLMKFASMVLKQLYLDGYPIGKNVFRQLATAGERHIASGKISGMSSWALDLLYSFPISSWREARCSNYQVLLDCLNDLEWVTMLQSPNAADICPFSVILIFDSHQRRNHIRQRLIDVNVYPSILWSLEEGVVNGIPECHIDLSRRMLSIHCDMRYSEQDMERVAQLIRSFGAELSL